jgi:hypothetical protein
VRGACEQKEADPGREEKESTTAEKRVKALSSEKRVQQKRTEVAKDDNVLLLPSDRERKQRKENKNQRGREEKGKLREKGYSASTYTAQSPAGRRIRRIEPFFPLLKRSD